MNRPPHPSLAPALRWVAVACAAAVWLLGVFAASSQLHDAVHADAGHADHTCAITLFSNGAEDATYAAVLAIAPALFPAGEMTAIPAVPTKGADDLLPPGRGPPTC